MIPISTEVLQALRGIAPEIPLTDDDYDILLAAIARPSLLDVVPDAA
jgi:hypothetical protein